MDILRNNQCFEAFKKSPYFQNFFEELDISREGSLISEEDVVGM